jgi:hypothetical protein
MVNPPIDLIPNTKPQRFKWRQVASTPIGPHEISHEGTFPPSMEAALVALINCCKQLLTENAELRALNAGHCDRIAGQSELLTRSAEWRAAAETLVGSVSLYLDERGVPVGTLIERLDWLMAKIETLVKDNDELLARVTEPMRESSSRKPR